MKNIFKAATSIAAIIAMTIMISCNKKEISSPTDASVFYKDQNIEISNFETQNISTDSLKILFKIDYAKNISNIEVLTGSNENQLCAFYQKELNENVLTAENIYCESNNAAKYFMIKFTLNDGNWGYTQLFYHQ